MNFSSHVHSTVMPRPLEIGPTTVYFRTMPTTDEQTEEGLFMYDEVSMSLEEYGNFTLDDFIGRNGIDQNFIAGYNEYTLYDKGQEVRKMRDELISKTDWTQTFDSPLSDEEQVIVRTYRQALRDVPQQEGFPLDVTWPEKPDCI